MRELYTFFGPRLAGVFRETSPGVATFEYATTAGATPVSLSLRPGEVAQPGAAYAYLDNLLPDPPGVRERWARERSLPDTDPFTLLASYGEDVAGALSLTPDQRLPEREREAVIEATVDDIAARVAALSKESSSWQDPRARPRMSLAGAQGKFTLAQVDGDWFWPTYELPSTHILKPPARAHKGIDVFEHLGLELARAVGVEASRSQQAAFLVVTT